MAVEVAPPLHLLLDTATRLRRRRASRTTRASTERARSSASPTRGSTSRTPTSSTKTETRASPGCSICRRRRSASTPTSSRSTARPTATATSSRAPSGTRRTSTRCSTTGQPSDLAQLPQDEVGHGTLVTACAASNGLQGRSALPGRRAEGDDPLRAHHGGGQRFDRQRRAVARHRVPLRPRRLPAAARGRQSLDRDRLRSARRDDGLGADARVVRRTQHPRARARRRRGQQRVDRRRSGAPERATSRRGRRCTCRCRRRSGVAERRRADLGRDARRRERERRARRARTARGSRRWGRTTPRARTRAATRGHLQRQLSRAAAPCPPARTARSSCGRARGRAGPTT